MRIGVQNAAHGYPRKAYCPTVSLKPNLRHLECVQLSSGRTSYSIGLLSAGLVHCTGFSARRDASPILAASRSKTLIPSISGKHNTPSPKGLPARNLVLTTPSDATTVASQKHNKGCQLWDLAHNQLWMCYNVVYAHPVQHYAEAGEHFTYTQRKGGLSSTTQFVLIRPYPIPIVVV